MRRYLVESYLHDAPGALAEARARAQEAADADGGVRHVRTTFLPEDEFVLDVFEAPTADALARALTRAGISFDRITEAAEPQEQEAAPEFSGNRIGRITPQGVITEFPLPGPGRGPNTIGRGEAESAADVRDASEVAGVPFARIVAAAEIGVDERGPTNEGGSS